MIRVGKTWMKNHWGWELRITQILWRPPIPTIHYVLLHPNKAHFSVFFKKKIRGTNTKPSPLSCTSLFKHE